MRVRVRVRVGLGLGLVPEPTLLEAHARAQAAGGGARVGVTHLLVGDVDTDHPSRLAHGSGSDEAIDPEPTAKVGDALAPREVGVPG